MSKCVIMLEGIPIIGEEIEVEKEEKRNGFKA